MFKAVVNGSGCALAVMLLLASTAAAQAGSGPEQRSLDEQVQEVKADVLDIAAELSLLEERLLYPSNTQVSVFVSMAGDAAFRLDAVRVAIDGELVAHYIYSFKELEALQKGGVQRIYTGNLPTGEHSLEIHVDGKSPDGGDYSRSRTFSFDKGVEPKALGLTLADAGANEAAIRLGNW